jgi:hypothetical protein
VVYDNNSNVSNSTSASSHGPFLFCCFFHVSYLFFILFFFYCCVFFFTENHIGSLHSAFYHRKTRGSSTNQYNNSNQSVYINSSWQGLIQGFEKTQLYYHNSIRGSSTNHYNNSTQSVHTNASWQGLIQGIYLQSYKTKKTKSFSSVKKKIITQSQRKKTDN